MTATCFVLVPAGAASAAKPRKPDSAPPSVAIAAPGSGTTVGGTISVTGTATDNAGLSKVEVAVDGGAFQLATGTSAWSRGVNTTAYSDGAHTITARATDNAGNATVKSETVRVSNAPPPTPTPTPAVDTTAPSVAITSPAAGATLNGTVNVAGTASDNVGVSTVEVSIDGAAWSLASGANDWSWGWNTAGVVDGQHTISARATDAAGNSTVTQQADAVQNTAPSPTLPPGVRERLVTPEGATILIFDDVNAWTAQQIYGLLKPSAYQLDDIGPKLTIKVQTTYASQTTTTASATSGVYTSFKGTIYLRATSDSGFTANPEFAVAHEYGHVWSMYHLYLTEQGNWSSWLNARGLAGDPRLDSSYNWSKNEMIADDYRVSFGSTAAVSQSAYINPQAPDPRDVSGLKDFLASSW